MYMNVIRSLCSLPATDLNFTAELERATSNQIRLAIETMEQSGGKNKGRIAACKRELRRRDREKNGHLIVKNVCNSFELTAERGEYCCYICKNVNFDCKACPIQVAFAKLYEYEAIGTTDGCKTAAEKQTAKKVISFDYHNGTVNYGCPVCKRKIISKVDGEWCGGTFNEYCDRCGQHLDWSDIE